jgi:hypothetical protein
VDGGRAEILPLHDGHPDPPLLLVSLRGLHRAPRSMARRGDRDRLPRPPCLQCRPDDRRREEVARLRHGQLRAVSAPAGADRRVSAVCLVRAVLSEHDPLLGEHRVHRPTARSRGGGLRLLYHGARRTSGGRTR